jgi:hypothetical protein
MDKMEIIRNYYLVKKISREIVIFFTCIIISIKYIFVFVLILRNINKSVEKCLNLIWIPIHLHNPSTKIYLNNLPSTQSAS